MTMHTPEGPATNHQSPATAFLRLLVRNHAGVMSHICGLFARRAFNLEGIVCAPVGDRSRSAMLLAVIDNERVDQLVQQLRKLEDVIEVARADDGDVAFEAASGWLR
jgi:acetolactate synthase-1/3 small subunit